MRLLPLRRRVPHLKMKLRLSVEGRKGGRGMGFPLLRRKGLHLKMRNHPSRMRLIPLRRGVAYLKMKLRLSVEGRKEADPKP